jgi:hypothetical protein
MDDKLAECFFDANTFVQNALDPTLFAAIFLCSVIFHAIKNPDLSRR